MHTGGCTSSSPHATTRHKEGCHGDSILFTLPQRIQFTPLNAPLPQCTAYLQEAGLEAKKQFPTLGHRHAAPRPTPEVRGQKGSPAPGYRRILRAPGGPSLCPHPVRIQTAEPNFSVECGQGPARVPARLGEGTKHRNKEVTPSPGSPPSIPPLRPGSHSLLRGACLPAGSSSALSSQLCALAVGAGRKLAGEKKK